MSLFHAFLYYYTYKSHMTLVRQEYLWGMWFFIVAFPPCNMCSFWRPSDVQSASDIISCRVNV